MMTVKSAAQGCTLCSQVGRQLASDVSALSDARKLESADRQVLMRAFDKAVRRKPLAFAADAVGLWKLHVGEEGRGEGVPVRSESNNGAVRMCCRVGAFGMTEHVKLRVVRGQDRSRRTAAERAKFWK